MSDKTLFQKIMDREIPADFVYEDDDCIVIKDIRPKAPLHLLIIPRKPLPDTTHLKEEDWPLYTHLHQVAVDLARKANCTNYRLQINTGEKAGQTVFHLHLHLIGWPEGN